MKYIFTFGYNTPRQMEHNQKFGWADEDSIDIVIDADSEHQAVEWGEEIAENFLKELFGDDSVSWKSKGYASFVALGPCELSGYDSSVGVGEHPNYVQMVKVCVSDKQSL